MPDERRILLCIDVQEGFVQEATRPVVSVIDRLIQATPFDAIIQTQWINDHHSNFVSKLFYKGCLPGTDEELVLKIPQSKIIDRSTYSAFDKRLQRLISKNDTIYVVGLETDACVLATCFALFDNGYTFHVVSDAVGTNREELQKPTLVLMRRNFGKDCLVRSGDIIF